MKIIAAVLMGLVCVSSVQAMQLSSHSDFIFTQPVLSPIPFNSIEELSKKGKESLKNAEKKIKESGKIAIENHQKMSACLKNGQSIEAQKYYLQILNRVRSIESTVAALENVGIKMLAHFKALNCKYPFSYSMASVKWADFYKKYKSIKELVIQCQVLIRVPYISHSQYL